MGHCHKKEISQSKQVWGQHFGGSVMSTILIIILILLLIGALPTWPYSSEWGYYPGGALGIVLIIVIILALTGRI
jgi:hypothetical protein